VPHRDDHDAALNRADALQAELDRERTAHAQQGDRIGQLERELREARTRLERAESTLGDLKPRKPVEPTPPPPAPDATPTGGGSIVVLGVGIVLLIVAFGVCVARKKDGTEYHPEPVAPKGPSVANQLIPDGLARVSSELLVAKIAVDYVDLNGTLDPSHGRITIETRKPKEPKPPDDPNRPTGAPPDHEPMIGMMMGHCPSQYWSPRYGWAEQTGSCMSFGEQPVGRPRCTIATILMRARADGAPDGLARVHAEWTYSVDVSALRSAWRWSFTISDTARGVSFQHDYADEDCPVER
jgi:hypothetical protein